MLCTRMLAFAFGGVLALAIAAAPGAETATVTGKVLDTMCLTNQGDNAAAEGHSDCALACAKKGAPMAIITDGGEVYTITGEYTENNNEKLLEFVLQEVEASGDVSDEGGTKTIEVATMALAAGS